MHPTTRALLEACSAVLDKGSTAEGALSVATSEWYTAGRPDLQPIVGGDPPVPGVGWGVQVVDERSVYTISSVYLDADGLDGVGVVVRGGVRADDIAALYRPGGPADQPYWRRE